jgi:predicted RNA-binding protein YlxR (DUF448 family)
LPVRTCVGCRRRCDAMELVRVVGRSDGTLAVGRSLPGRGAWLCKSRHGCFERAKRRGQLERALRQPISDDGYRLARAAIAAQQSAEASAPLAASTADGRSVCEDREPPQV